MMLPSYCTYYIHYYRERRNIPVEAFGKKECRCYITLNVYENESDCWVDSDAFEVCSCNLYSDHMRKHLTSVSTIKREGSQHVTNKFR